MGSVMWQKVINVPSNPRNGSGSFLISLNEQIPFPWLGNHSNLFHRFDLDWHYTSEGSIDIPEWFYSLRTKIEPDWIRCDVGNHLVWRHFRYWREYIFIWNSNLVYLLAALLSICHWICFLDCTQNTGKGIAVHTRSFSISLWRSTGNHFSHPCYLLSKPCAIYPEHGNFTAIPIRDQTGHRINDFNTV